MRCILRNAGAFMAMVWSGAVGALAGPVNIRTSLETLNPAAIVRADWRPFAQVEPLAARASLAPVARRQWFPDRDGIAPPAVLAAPRVRPAAIVIPLPASVWFGAAGLGCAVFVAQVLNPRRCPRRALP